MKDPKVLEQHYKHWEVTKDLIDQCIDIMLNLRQSGHPGGSRSKVHAMVVALLSGAMRWDIRDPTKRFSDRFVLVAGHDNPMVYATLKNRLQIAPGWSTREKPLRAHQRDFVGLRGEPVSPSLILRITTTEQPGAVA